MRSGIIAGGNWLIDQVKVIDAWPPQDALATILSQSSANGGGPYNVLKDLAKLGAPFPLEGIGLVGDDAAGQLIRADCAAHRIDTSQLRVTRDAPTSYTDVMTVAATGRRTFFHQRGANAHLGPEHFDFKATRARHFHLAYLLLLDRLDAVGADGRPQALDVFRRAHAAGLRTSLDCVSDTGDRFESVVAPVLPEVDVLFANEFEAAKLTGLPLDASVLTKDAALQAARALLARGVRDWCVLHWPAGVCACSTRGETLWQPRVALPAAQIAGTVGAGDALAAGVLYALHEGGAMAHALELGVAAAAASLRRNGASDGVESAERCLALAREFGFAAG